MTSPTGGVHDELALDELPPSCRCSGERHAYGAPTCHAAAAVPPREPVATDPYETPGRFVVLWDEPTQRRRVVFAQNQAAASTAIEQELRRSDRYVPSSFRVMPEALA